MGVLNEKRCKCAKVYKKDSRFSKIKILENKNSRKFLKRHFENLSRISSWLVFWGSL